MTDHEAIIQYMKDFGSISNYEAYTDLDTTKLSTRVGELIKAGYNIEKKWETRVNRYGKVKRYMRYTLGG